MPTAIILISATTAGFCDLRWQRIPNWLVVITILLSLIWHTAVSGLSGLWMSLAGLLVGTAVLFPLFMLRGMGAGDVKFFGAVSAAVTFKYVFTLFLISAVIAALMAIFRALWGGVLLATVANLFRLIGWFLRGRFRSHPVLNIASGQAIAIPFGVSVAIAAWIFILFGKV